MLFWYFLWIISARLILNHDKPWQLEYSVTIAYWNALTDRTLLNFKLYNLLPYLLSWSPKKSLALFMFKDFPSIRLSWNSMRISLWILFGLLSQTVTSVRHLRRQTYFGIWLYPLYIDSGNTEDELIQGLCFTLFGGSKVVLFQILLIWLLLPGQKHLYLWIGYCLWNKGIHSTYFPNLSL